MAGPAVLRRWLEPVGNGGPQIDGRLAVVCREQNPAYRPAHLDIKEHWRLAPVLFYSISI